MGPYLSRPDKEKVSEDGKSNRLSYGSCSMQGWRKTQEDAHCCILKYAYNTSLFAVYDGHGGAEVAVYCKEHMPSYIRANFFKGFELALKEAFINIDESLKSPEAQEQMKAVFTSLDNLQKKVGTYDLKENVHETSKLLNENTDIKNEIEKEINENCKSDRDKNADASKLIDNHINSPQSNETDTSEKKNAESKIVTENESELNSGSNKMQDAFESNKNNQNCSEYADDDNDDDDDADDITSNWVTCLLNDDGGDDDNDDDEEDDDDDYQADENEDKSTGDSDSDNSHIGYEEGETEHKGSDEALDFCTEDSCKIEPGYISGCTANVAVLKDNMLYVANVGDSRCVLSRNGKAFDMSSDHLPLNNEEYTRIVKAGGTVTADGRINSGLNLSRALGDHNYKSEKLPPEDQIVSCVPDIKVISIDPDTDDFMVLACDGIWNCMTSQDVINFVQERLSSDSYNRLSMICEELFESCIKPNVEGDGTGCDNMTCIIVKFHKCLKSKVKRTHSDEDGLQSEKKIKLETNENEH